MDRRVLIGFLATGSALLVMGLTYSRGSYTQYCIDIEAPPDRVYRVVSDPATWPAWSPWRELGPELRLAELPAGASGRGGSGASAGFGASGVLAAPLGCGWEAGPGRAGQIRLTARREGRWLETVFCRRGKELAWGRWSFEALASGGTRVTWTLRSRAPVPPPVRRLRSSLARGADSPGHGLSLLAAEVGTAPP